MSKLLEETFQRHLNYLKKKIHENEYNLPMLKIINISNIDVEAHYETEYYLFAKITYSINDQAAKVFDFDYYMTGASSIKDKEDFIYTFVGGFQLEEIPDDEFGKEIYTNAFSSFIDENPNVLSELEKITGEIASQIENDWKSNHGYDENINRPLRESKKSKKK